MKKLFKYLTTCLLLVVSLLTMIACAPSTISEAKKKMEDSGYTTIYCREINDGGVIATANFMRIENGKADNIKVFLYEDAKTANSLKSKYQKGLGEGEVVTVSGKWIIIGTKQATSDFVK